MPHVVVSSSPVDGDTAQESAGILKLQHELFEQGKEYYIDIQQLSKPFQSSSAGGLDYGIEICNAIPIYILKPSELVGN